MEKKAEKVIIWCSIPDGNICHWTGISNTDDRVYGAVHGKLCLCHTCIHYY